MQLRVDAPATVRAQVAQYQPGQVSITIITVEEQMRGRLAQIKRAANPVHLRQNYLWLHETVDSLARFPMLDFDEAAQSHFERLKTLKIRVGTQDF